MEPSGYSTRRILLIVLSAVVLINVPLWFYFYSQGLTAEKSLEEIRAAYQLTVAENAQLQQQLAKRDSDAAITANPAFLRVDLKGTVNDPSAKATVYWNPESYEGYVNASRLKPISSDKQFQVWAIVRGKTVAVGIFDSPGTGLHELKPIEGASAFAITVEPRGGRDQPTLTNLQVIGSVFIIPT